MKKVLAAAIGGLCALSAIALPTPPASASTDATTERPRVVEPDDSRPSATPLIPLNSRAEILGSGWKSVDDTAYTATGDEDGFHVMRGFSDNGFTWRPIVTLAVPGVETSRWVGNYCVANDGKQLLVVYAPREATNSEKEFNEGAYAAIVNTADGTTRSLGRGYSLAYHNPGCGGRFGVLQRTAGSVSYVGVVDLSKASRVGSAKLSSRVYSAVPEGDGRIVAAAPGAIVRVDTTTGLVAQITKTDGIARRLAVDRGNGLNFIIADRGTERVERIDLSNGSHQRELTRGALGSLDVAGTGTGDVVISGGDSPTDALPSGITRVAAHTDLLTPSLKGQLIEVSSILRADGSLVARGKSRTGKTLSATTAIDLSTAMTATPFNTRAAGGSAASGAVAIRASGTQPWDEGTQACAVPRNDPKNAAWQPKPRQAEWAVDRVIEGALTISRPANWNNLGMAAYRPGDMFPKVALSGGGRIPAQVLLGVLMQESNLWQASRYTYPGQTGNPLIGNYYGTSRSASYSDAAFWTVDFSKADCGYGIGQVTDGMRLPGSGGPTAQQRAIALDYTANIARAAQILSEKWNQTRDAGLIVNNGDSSKPENWYFALWAYNTGFYARSSSGPWGVGWSNNPANPDYPGTRRPFLINGYDSDAAIPQNWPYEEKILGWAAAPPQLIEEQLYAKNSPVYVAAFRQASWNGTADSAPKNRTASQARPVTLFCDPSVNQCTNPGGCQRSDYKCWWNQPVTWKSDCATTCGVELNRFTPAASYMTEQSWGASFAPNCSTAGLPAGALVVDDLRLDVAGSVSSSPVTNPNCTNAVSSVGSLSLQLGNYGSGTYPSGIDLHQLGGGFNGHMFFTHTHPNASSYAGKISGTWTLDRSLTAWTRVLVHVPDIGAWTQNARYVVDDGAGLKRTRVVQQRLLQNQWVSLGVFKMNGVPSVYLDNIDPRLSASTDGTVDVAWDAVAFSPLASKPADVVVALGDSYSSGEGSGTASGGEFITSSDVLGGEVGQDSCHRSLNTWSSSAKTPSSSSTIRERGQNLSADLDYHLLACSGAISANILPTGISNAAGDITAGQWGEPTQIDMGYLDPSTTLVTLSVGGNDVGFAPVLVDCIIHDACLSAPADYSAVESKIAVAGSSVRTVLREIRSRAPNARVVVSGYPPLFEGDASCLASGVINAGEAQRIGSLGATLNDQLRASVTQAASDLNAPIKYIDPSSSFAGRSICKSDPAINNFILTLTPGDAGLGVLKVPGEDVKYGPSQQSIHPNKTGYALWGGVLTNTLASW